MINIELIKKTEDYKILLVNGRTIKVVGSSLSAANRAELNDVEQKATNWFIKSSLKIKSSIYK
jgi:hypothetical protein